MMKQRVTLLIALVITTIAGSQATAQMEPGDLVIGGFADVVWMLDDGGQDDEVFGVGQAEIDLAATVDPAIDVEMAVAYDADAGAFGLGALIVYLRLLGDDDTHLHRSGLIRHAGLAVGQMDVPFGIDWQVYPSIDRLLISGPLAVSATHDGWNDVGCAAYLEASRLNAVAYVVNGTGHGAADAAVATSIGSALGARLGLPLFSTLEVGGSYAGILDDDGGRTASLAGADLQLAVGPLFFKGETIWQETGADGDASQEIQGSYLQAAYLGARYFLVARYGWTDPEPAPASDEARLCLGAGWVVRPGAQIRLEHQVGERGLPNRMAAQLVVGF